MRSGHSVALDPAGALNKRKKFGGYEGFRKGVSAENLPFRRIGRPN